MMVAHRELFTASDVKHRIFVKQPRSTIAGRASAFSAAPRPIVGADRVAAFLSGLARLPVEFTTTPMWLNGAPAARVDLGGELNTAERTARILIRLTPFRESGYRYLMEALAQSGNAAEALNVYESLRTLLREELGATPSPATQALHRALLG